MSTLPAFMAQDLRAGDLPAGVEQLAAAIIDRHGNAVKAILLYGSCRRKSDVEGGLVDLLVIVSGYRATFGNGLTSLLNWLLPPNVYYLETKPHHANPSEQRTVRCKYAVISERQFRRRMQARSDHYFWARFCQPMRLITGDSEQAIAEARADGARSFIDRIAPLARQPLKPEQLWSLALATTYRCELRPEPPDNARRLIAHDPDYWYQISDLLAAEGRLLAGDHGYQAVSGQMRYWQTRASWMLRRVSGKIFNLARLFKAAGTFSNGIDYIVWKVERHSGVRIEPTDRMRRYPRLAAWGLAWRLWRGGGFR